SQPPTGEHQRSFRCHGSECARPPLGFIHAYSCGAGRRRCLRADRIRARCAALAAACTGSPPAALAERPAPPPPIIPPPVQPANIGDLKFTAIDYYNSGAYLTDLPLAAAPAIAWISDEAPRAIRPAVVFDIDETALSNWE